MSKSRRTRRRPRPAAPAAAGRRLPLLAALVVLAVTVVAVSGYWWSQARQGDTLAPFQKLQGRWQRNDGGYVIDIRTVEPGGKLTAGYFNPRPINVARAEASQDGETVKAFIELRDVNYPGSTYNLIYSPADDRLTGTYFQAVERTTYDVYFTRLKP